jgi:hypothetical protein
MASRDNNKVKVMIEAARKVAQELKLPKEK